MVVRQGRYHTNLISVGVAGIALLLGACTSSSNDSAPSSGVTVSGKLTQATVADVGNPVSRYEAKFATTGTTIALDCGSKGIFTATVDATTGDFSVAGVPTGEPCTFSFNDAAKGTVKCQVQFTDANNYDLNHNPMSTNTATPSSNIALGSITCDSSGTVSVATDSVSGVNAGSTISSSTAFDFTGTWTAAAYDGALPTGYQTITNCTSDCHGPAIGDKITLIRFHGYKFTPTAGHCTPATNVTCATTDGTVDTSVEGYGMSIWGGDYAHGPGACGNTTGFSADEARAFAGLSLDATAPNIGGNQMSYGHYVFTTPTGFGGDTGWTQPWMYTGATSNWTIMDCQPVAVPNTGNTATKAGYACFASTVTNGSSNNYYVWSVGLANAGGCIEDSTGLPLMVNNWANITGTCDTPTASTFNSNLSVSSCHYTGSPQSGAASTAFTCSWTGGSFLDVSGGHASTDNNAPNFSAPYTMPANTWNGQPGQLLAAGATCAGATSEATLKTNAASAGTAAARAAAAKELMYRYQCYANQYWQHSSNGAGSATSCPRNYSFDWSTNNYLNFVIGDDRSMKPQNAFITDRVFYSPDGKWGFVKNKETRYQSIPTASGSTLCPMNNIIELKFGKVSDTKILVNFSQRTVMADRSATCQGAVEAAIKGGGTLSPDPTGLNNLYRELQPAKMMFYMNK